MASTGSDFVAAGGGGLPAPKVRVTGGGNAWQTVSMPVYSPSGTLTDVQVQPVTVTVTDVPSVFTDSAFGLQLELMRYRYRRSKARANLSGEFRSWVHPSNGPAPSGDGTWTRGGAHLQTSPAVVALRRTEWPVTNTSSVDVSQAMFSFLCQKQIPYRSVLSTGVPDATVLGFSPKAGSVGWPGRRFAYSSAYTPGLFAFRLSVVDVDDPRGARVSGPLSEMVCVSNTVFPFRVDSVSSQLLGKQTASIAPGYDPLLFRAWIGSTTRLPG